MCRPVCTGGPCGSPAVSSGRRRSGPQPGPRAATPAARGPTGRPLVGRSQPPHRRRHRPRDRHGREGDRGGHLARGARMRAEESRRLVLRADARLPRLGRGGGRRAHRSGPGDRATGTCACQGPYPVSESLIEPRLDGEESHFIRILVWGSFTSARRFIGIVAERVARRPLAEAA